MSPAPEAIDELGEKRRRERALKLKAAAPDLASVRFQRGRSRPRAIAWFGFSAFWGHLRHLAASAIATENIDSRQWMMPETPTALLDRCLSILEEAGAQSGPTLASAMGGEVWIDFVADTGDDFDVSRAVAVLLTGEYLVDDPDEGELLLPRGTVLFLGGDLAYPVATVREITRRLVHPWNEVLEAKDDAMPRLLLAVPGNHDWYDGLDGFARLCQAHCDFEKPIARRETLNPVTSAFPVLAWAEAFTRGETVRKPDALALVGYFPAQRTSYFRLPLAKGLELWGVDRQLKNVDGRQKDFFRTAPGDARMVVLPDPARAWGEQRPDGVASLESIGLDPSKESAYVLSGDIHHYERSNEGDTLHVVAGGGGAFLQGARIAGKPAYAIDAEFPGPKASGALLRGLPWHMASGGGGWLIVSILGLFEATELGAHVLFGRHGSVPLAILHCVVVAVSTGLLIGWRRHRVHRVLPFAIAFGVLIGAMPLGLAVAVDGLGVRVLGPTMAARGLALAFSWLLATLASGAAFGAMLALLARLGLNHAQPFAALGLPTHKHIVRIRVRETDDGPRIDTFVIGQVDPVGKSTPVLVDRFRWRPRARSK